MTGIHDVVDSSSIFYYGDVTDGCYTDTNLIFLWNLEWDRLDISNKVDNEINISLYCLY